MGEDKQQPRDISEKLSEYRERHKLAGHSRPKPRELSVPPPPSDELATSIQASVNEVAVMWILHNWSRAKEHQPEPLDQQIKNFSTAALEAIAAHCPMLRNAKQEHLWLIYLKGLLAADTHPREQMIRAIKAVGERSWIHASGKTAANAPANPTDDNVKSAHGDLSDLDALEHIREALAAD
jgi:hypothetical protein